MEKLTRLTPYEWAVQTYGYQMHDDVEKYMTEYADYVLANQQVSSDVEAEIKCIIMDNLNIEIGDKDDIRASTLHNVKMQSVIDAVTAGYQLATSAKPAQVDWDKLKEGFFNYCTCKYSDGLPKVNIAPHNLFEWFKMQLSGKDLNESEAVEFGEWITCENIINIDGEWYYDNGVQLIKSDYKHTDKTTAELYNDFKTK